MGLGFVSARKTESGSAGSVTEIFRLNIQDFPRGRNQCAKNPKSMPPSIAPKAARLPAPMPRATNMASTAPRVAIKIGDRMAKDSQRSCQVTRLPPTSRNDRAALWACPSGHKILHDAVSLTFNNGG